MIKLYNLTKDQYDTLEEMWSIDSFEDLMRWKEKQPKWKKLQVQTLILLVALAYIDEEVEIDNKLTLAKKLLDLPV